MLDAARPVKVVVAPVLDLVAPPGEAVMVQAPAGNPLKATLAVAVAQVGCVIVPTTGAEGVTGCALMTALPEADDTHPEEVRVTVKV